MTAASKLDMFVWKRIYSDIPEPVLTGVQKKREGGLLNLDAIKLFTAATLTHFIPDIKLVELLCP